jgi:hypothetical protein
MGGGGSVVPRRAAGSPGLATITRTRVEIIFQRYPGTDANSAIRGLDYHLTPPEGPGSFSTTSADGKVAVSLAPGETAQLEIMGTTYEIRLWPTLEPVTQRQGYQRRLKILGYYTDNVDGTAGPNTEYALLHYQADNAPLKIDGLAGNQTQTSIRNKVGE